MAYAIGLTATTMGGLGIGTNSWAREYQAGNAALCAVNAALAAGRGYTVNEDMLEAARGFLAVFSGGKADTAKLTHDLGKEWDIIDFLAIKLWPGAHPFSGTVEAAMVRGDDLPTVLLDERLLEHLCAIINSQHFNFLSS